MSVRVMSRVWEAYPGAGSELLALLAMADWSDDDGRCWPSIAAIARKIRLSRSQAQRTVHRLIETRFVVVTGNETGGARGSTRQYQIILDRLMGGPYMTNTGSTHATGSAGATGSTHAQEGSHPCGDTGSTHATQTIIDTSRTINTSAGGEKSPPAVAEKAIFQKKEKPKSIALSDSGEWMNIAANQLTLWSKAYPALCLDAELASAASWILANPANKKSNYGRFLTNWLKRAQDKAPRAGGNAPSKTERDWT